MQTILQFKLDNSEEIICEVIQWPDEDNPVYIIRNCVLVMPIDLGEFSDHVSEGRPVSDYLFKPWMMYQDSPKDLQTLSSDKISAAAKPPKELIMNYLEMVQNMNFYSQERKRYYKQVEQKELEELEKRIYSELASLFGEEQKKDSAQSNIIQFPSSDKVH